MALSVLCLGTHKSQTKVLGAPRVWRLCPEVGDQSVGRAVHPESSRELLPGLVRVPVAPGLPWRVAASFPLHVTISVGSSLLFLVRTLAGCRAHLQSRVISSCNPELGHVCKDPLPKRGPTRRVCGRIFRRTCQPTHPSCLAWGSFGRPPSQSPRSVPGEASHTHLNVRHPKYHQCLCRNESGDTPC